MAGFATIGLAGHTGHGKTTLARFLSGKAVCGQDHSGKNRMASHELRVEPLLNGGMEAFLMDVPGKARFVKNAFRGLFAVDMAILVVAANHGVMPGTREHIRVLTYLGIPCGFMVLNQIGKEDAEILELARLDIEEAVEGTCLEGQPILDFSPENPENLKKIINVIEQRAHGFKGKATDAPFRMWVDQVRRVQGIGTLACGTILSGEITQDDRITLLPDGKSVRARYLENPHGKISHSVAGQRVGVCLPGVSRNEIRCGMVLEGSARQDLHPFLNVKMQTHETIFRGQRVRLHLGTAAMNVMVVPMEKESLEPKDHAWVQLRLSRPLPAAAGDRFLLTSLNRYTVLGGGVVAEVSDYKFKLSRRPATVGFLNGLEEGDARKMVLHFLKQRVKRTVSLEDIEEHTGLGKQVLESALNQMIESKEILILDGNRYGLWEEFQELCEILPPVIHQILSKEPFRGKTSPEAVRKHLQMKVDKNLMEYSLKHLALSGKILFKDSVISFPMHLLKLSKNSRQVLDELLSHMDGLGTISFSAESYCREAKTLLRKEKIQPFLDFLQSQGKLIRLNNDEYISVCALEKIKEKVAGAIREKGSIAMTDSKMILGFGRTKGASVFEYLDEIGFTFRNGNERVLRV